MEDVPELKRRLRAARQRAAYWSGRPSTRGFGFRPGSRGRPKHGHPDLEYETAMCDITTLAQMIGERTGKFPKVSDPAADWRRRYSELFHKNRNIDWLLKAEVPEFSTGESGRVMGGKLPEEGNGRRYE